MSRAEGSLATPSLHSSPVFSHVLDALCLGKRVLILGDSQLAGDLIRVLESKNRFQYEVVGILTNDPCRVGEILAGEKIIGTFEHLGETVQMFQVNTIAVCLKDRRGCMPLESLLELKAKGLDIVDGHHLYEASCGRISIDELKPSTLIFSSGFRRRPIMMWVKRVEDVIGAGLGILLLAPFLGLLVLLIRMDSPGPVFFKQTRVGYRGKPYVLLKFRSMRHEPEETGAQWAVLGDRRVTRVGRWLRLLRIDEIPQLLNVLKGEMSLVGPRPEQPAFVTQLRKIIPYYDLRHTVRPGITGWAQTRFQYAASVEDSHMKLQYDLYYVKNLSLMLDASIILRTVRVIFGGVGAR